MKHFMAITGFELKRLAKSGLFLLTLLISIAMFLSGQMQYIQYYQLRTPEDYGSIRGDHKEVPLDGQAQKEYFYSQVANTIATPRAPQAEQERFMQLLRQAMGEKENWALAEIDALQKELAAEFPWLSIYQTDTLLSNLYTHSWTQDADYAGLKAYIAGTGRSFMLSFAREYSQDASMLFSISFLCFFAFLFQREAKAGSRELLLAKPMPPGMVFYSKMLSAFLLCLASLAAATCAVLGLLYAGGTAFGLRDVLVMGGYLCIYTLPTLVFVLGLAVLLTVATKSGFTVLPIYMLLMLGSMQNSSDAAGKTVQNLFTSVIVMDNTSFFFPVESGRLAAELVNRAVVLALGLLMLALARWRWSRSTAPAKGRAAALLQAVWAKAGGKKEKPGRRAPRKSPSFVVLNAKICLSGFFTACAAILLFSNILLQRQFHVTEIGPLILANSGWAAIALFANLFAVEYARGTDEPLALARRQASTVWAVRVAIAAALMLALVVAAFLLGLWQLGAQRLYLQTALICLGETVAACMVAALFMGMLAATLANLFRNGWVGLCIALALHILFLRRVEDASVFNLYLYKIQYSIIDSQPWLWLQSILMYTLLALALFGLNGVIVNRRIAFRLRPGVRRRRLKSAP